MLDNFVKSRYISLNFKGKVYFFSMYEVDTTSEFNV